MIHRIAIENFGAIREQQVLELRLSSKSPNLARFRESHSNDAVRLPTVVALFGANGSGKSTVLRAVTTVLDFVVNSFKFEPDEPLFLFQPFRAAAWWGRPTRISIDFDAQWTDDEARLFRYELAIANDPRAGDHVLAEALLVRKGRFRQVFRRNGQAIRCMPELDLKPGDPRLQSVRPNASVIATLAQLNVPFFLRALEDIRPTQRNMLGHFRVQHEFRDALSYLADNENAKDLLIHELVRLDIGLEQLEIFKEKDNKYSAYFHHKGLEGPILDFEESQGTQDFIMMFPRIFYTLATGRPAFIDEFDVNLHPFLTAEIIRWFHDPDRNKDGAQLFLAAQNPSLMDELEKEELFLIEKSREGAVQVVPARDIQGLRREPSLARKYLGGVLGAVPNIG